MSMAEAPWYTIPPTIFVNIEHPGMVKDLDNGIASLGGARALGKFLESDNQQRAVSLFLQPEDPFRRPIISQAARTPNLVFKITVPKRIGKKRKRKAFNLQDLSNNTPNQIYEKTHGAPSYVLRSVRDNISSYYLTAIGYVNETHRFRGIPDFQYSVMASSLAKRMQTEILPFKYENFKNFSMSFDNEQQSDEIDMIPPPIFSHSTLPFNYAYRQNPAIVLTQDSSGKQATINTASVPRSKNQLVSGLLKDMPVCPPADVPPEHQLDTHLQEAIKRLRHVLEERPIVTKRALLNMIPREFEYELKYAFQYTAYLIRSGPWRDAIVKLGIDPRSDPKYRQYQTFIFKTYSDEPNLKSGRHKSWWDRRKKIKSDEPDGHFFDGIKLVPDGKSWQVCDITDPFVQRLLNVEVRTVCDAKHDGWYPNGAMSKVRVVMRDKIRLIMEGKVPSDSAYEDLVRIPNTITDDTPDIVAQPGTILSSQTINLATQIKALARRSTRTQAVATATENIDAASDDASDSEVEGPDDFESNEDEIMEGAE